ncbi:MAG: DUF4249 domain-containing protein [Bacteroidota bacterium]
MIKCRYFIACILVAAGFSCKETYEPDVISSASSYLVVEGVLNTGGPASVSISRTTKLDSTGFRGVLNAQVTVEGRDNSTRPLAQTGGGIYSSPNLNLVLNSEYRLRIRTTDGKEYLSEYVKARSTPPIDSIGWKRNDEGVRLYVNTHDASGNTRYYRWDYDETWEITSYYYSTYIYTGGIVRNRTPAELVFQGWKYNYSKSILLSSSARLQSDIIAEAPVNFIANHDEKLSVRYSILLRQYALDKKGYEFYELMKRNTESLGTIFDAQPSETRGNIQCITNPAEPVIGYVSASSVAEKRIFISNSELPLWGFEQNCPSIEVANNPASIRDAYLSEYLSPYQAVFVGFIRGYLSSYPSCVDCTKRGASVIRPSYW